jgi:hypothetical protein
LNFRANVIPALAVVALSVALFELVSPFFGIPSNGRIRPYSLILIAILLLARHAVYLQTKKRSEILKDVPERPLGISEESSDRGN